MPNPTSCSHFSSVFPKKAWVILCKTDPYPIWTTLLRFGQTHLVWKQAGVLESSGPVSGRTQPARYQFPTFTLGSVLPQTSRKILCKTSLDQISLCLIVSNGSGPEASRCARTIHPASGQCFPVDPDRMRIGSGMFTGNLRTMPCNYFRLLRGGPMSFKC